VGQTPWSARVPLDPPVRQQITKAMKKRKAIKKLSAPRAACGDVAKAKRILKRTGRGKPPVPGDEIA
jgi:hypothetical protein